MNGVREWFSKNYVNLIIFSYIIPILFAAGVSIAHVITWYDITNPSSWAVYLSVGVEIAALSSLAGIAVSLNRYVYIPFFIVTFIQLIGNVFFSYQYIDVTSDLFLSWVELTQPLMDSWGLIENPNDLIAHKRYLAFLSGGLIPMISLTFLHLLVSFIDDNNKKKIGVVVESEPKIEVKKKTEIIKEVIDNPVVFEDVIEEEIVEPRPIIVDPDDIGDAPPVEEEFSEPKIFDEVDTVLVDEPIPYINNEVEKELDVFDDIEDVIKEEAKKLEEEPENNPTILLNRDVRVKQNRINKLKNRVLERVQQKKDELLKQNEPKKGEVTLEEPAQKKVTKLVYRNKRKEIDDNSEDRGFSVKIPKPPKQK
jgi:hypothetical protein